MDKLPEWLRWFIVDHIFNRLYPGACWCDMVRWAMRFCEWEDVDLDAHNCKPGGIYFDEKYGGCYCGKYATPEALKAREA